MTVRAILCPATGRAYTNETLAYLSGCDVENATESDIPSDATYIYLGVPAGGDAVVFSDSGKAFAWMMANLGSTVTALKVERHH